MLFDARMLAECLITLTVRKRRSPRGGYATLHTLHRGVSDDAGGDSRPRDCQVDKRRCQRPISHAMQVQQISKGARCTKTLATQLVVGVGSRLVAARDIGRTTRTSTSLRWPRSLSYKDNDVGHRLSFFLPDRFTEDCELRPSCRGTTSTAAPSANLKCQARWRHARTAEEGPLNACLKAS